MLKIFCTVCKDYIEVKNQKQFRESGHYEGTSHLLAPNPGRSSRRHQRAMNRDQDRIIRKAELAKEHADA